MENGHASRDRADRAASGAGAESSERILPPLPLANFRTRFVVPDDVKDEWLPYFRTDMYGNFGLRRWPWYEYIRLPVFAITVLPLRVTVLAIVSVSLRVAAAIQTMLGTRAARVYAHINGMFSCMTGVVCGFGVLPRVIVVDAPPAGCPDRFTENGVLMRPPLVISNHSSYVDVAMMSGLLYPSFVARAGTEKLPFYGPVSKTIRCILVERERPKSSAGQEEQRPSNGNDLPLAAQQVVDRLRELRERARTGRPFRSLMIFPEGTTTNGHFLMQFRIGAFRAGVPVQPYLHVYRSTTASVSWESMSFPMQFFLVLCSPFTLSRTYALPPYYPSAQEEKDPLLYSRNVHSYMVEWSKRLPWLAERGGLIPTDATLADKRDFHRWLLSGRLQDAKKAE